MKPELRKYWWAGIVIAGIVTGLANSPYNYIIGLAGVLWMMLCILE